MKNVMSTQYSNPQPLEHESSPMTTRLGLQPSKFGPICLTTEFFSRNHHRICPIVKHVWNAAVDVLFIFLGFVIYTTTYHMGRYEPSSLSKSIAQTST